MQRFALLATAALIPILAGCGGGSGDDGVAEGGGGGGGGTVPEPIAVTYSGNTSQAVITNSNASTLVAESVGGTDVGAATSSLTGDPTAREERMLPGRRLARTFRATLAQPRADGSSRLTSAVIDETETCRNGGTVRYSGDLAAGTGFITVTYNNCREDEDALTGQATMFIFHSLGRPGLPPVALGFTVTFTRLAVRGQVSADISGSVKVQVSESLDSETITENIVTLYNRTGRITQSGNLVFVDTYDHAVLPTSYTETVNGRVFDSVHGYFDISTRTPLHFPTLTQAYPSSGVLVYTGAGLGNNRRILVTALSATMVALALDFDGDGHYERHTQLKWDQLDGPVGADLGDTDSDRMHNSWETAFGLNPGNDADASGDPDGDGHSNQVEYQNGTNPLVAN